MAWEERVKSVDEIDETPFTRVGPAPLQSLVSVDVAERALMRRRQREEVRAADARAVQEWRLFIATRERERERRRALHAQAEEISERRFTDHVMQGRVALGAVLAGAAAVGAMVDVRAWSKEEKVAYAGGSLGLGVVCAWGEGREAAKRELRKINAELIESRFVEGRAEAESAGSGDWKR
jgi:hypothetical protein